MPAMQCSMADYLNVITPYLQINLVSSDALSRIRKVTQSFPPFHIAGFECRLGENQPRVDFLVGIPHGSLSIPKTFKTHPVWQAIDKLYQIWSDPTSVLFSQVRDLGLEFDLDEPPSEISIPCVFFALNRDAIKDAGRLQELASYWPMKPLFDQSDSPLLASNVLRCLYALPEGAGIAHLGVMLSRPQKMVRVVVKGIPAQQIPDYLTQIGWTDTTNTLPNLITTLSEFVDYIVLDLNIGETLYPQIGLECRIKKQPPQDSRWELFIDYLVAKDLCTLAKKKSLLSWVGMTQKADCPDLWPSNLQMGDSLAGSDALSLFYRTIYHIKIVYRPDFPLSAKAYLEFGHSWFDYQSSTSLETESVRYRQQIRSYYDCMTPIILQQIGATYQAGLLLEESDDNLFEKTNLYCAASAGIQPEHYILDAGCGVCGPSIDIARHIEGIKIEAITLSPVQASIAKDLVQQAGFKKRIRVHIGDFHNLPFADDVFDVVMFLEAAGYSDDPHLLFSEVYRVLRPGGVLYIKDAFVKEFLLSEQEKWELAQFNRIYAILVTRMSDTVRVITSAGFDDIISRDLKSTISDYKAHQAMFEEQDGKQVLTEFGRLHYRESRCLPIIFGEIKARKRFS